MKLLKTNNKANCYTPAYRKPRLRYRHQRVSLKAYFQTLSLITTFLIGFIIIAVGYRVLDIIGDYFIITDSAITPHSVSDNSSYIFYAQSENDIILFPWNYYDESNPSYYDYLMNFVQLYTDDLYLGDYIDSDEFYERIRYSFYQSVPDIKESIIKAGTSLYEIMDFENIIYELSVSDVPTGQYLFYDNNIYIEDLNGIGTYYHLSFALDTKLELLSFNCRPVHSGTEYTSTVMELGKNQLTNMINYNNGDSLSILIYDMTAHAGILENYKLSRTSYNNYVLNVADEEYASLYYYDNYYNEYFKNYDDSDKKDESEVELDLYAQKEAAIDISVSDIEDISNNQSQSQIVETDDEILIIVTDNNIVLHYDPIDKVFTGFNRISE